jgi:hypothetical protein
MSRASIILLLLASGWCEAVAPAPDDGEIPPLRPPLKEMAPGYWEANRSRILGGGMAALFLGACSFLLLRGMLRKEPLGPSEQARLGLERMRGSNTEDLSAVSRLTRRCIGGMFGLPDRELTTAEFCGELEARVVEPDTAATNVPAQAAGASFDGAAFEKTKAFLDRCDTRKFAPGRSLETWDAAGEALALVDEASRLQQSAARRQTS